MSSLFCHSWQFWFWFWFCVEPSTTVLVLILEFVKMCIFKISLRDLHALNDQLWVQMWWWRRTGHPGIESSGRYTFSASESHFIHLYSIVSSTDLQIGRICALLWLLLKQINVPFLSCLVLSCVATGRGLSCSLSVVPSTLSLSWTPRIYKFSIRAALC